MVKNPGDWFEQKIVLALQRIPCYHFRFKDFKSYMHLVARSNVRIPKAPCDRLVVKNSICYFLEMKHTQQPSFPFQDIADHQITAGLELERKGEGISYVLINYNNHLGPHNPKNRNFCFAVRMPWFAKYVVTATRKSLSHVDLLELTRDNNTCKNDVRLLDYIKYKTEYTWDLEPLFKVNKNG